MRCGDPLPWHRGRPRRTVEETKGGAVATQSERVAAWIVAAAIVLIVAAFFLLILIGDVSSPL